MTGEPATAEVEFAIPERSGEVVIVPPLDRVPALLSARGPVPPGRPLATCPPLPGTGRKGGTGVQVDGAAVLGMPLAEFRRRVRSRAMGLLRSPGGVPPGLRREPALVEDRPIILMGHQPLFFHPGVWFKYFLLSRLCEAHDAVGLHLIVDTDAPGPIDAVLPARREHLARVTETLVPLAQDAPLESAPVPSRDEWRAFIERTRRHVGTLGAPELLTRLDAFAAGEEAVRENAGTLAEYLAGLRRRYEAAAGVPGYGEVPVSRLADTPEFRLFALHLLVRPDDLAAAYNGCLDAYRRAHRLRSPANPFPDLGQRCGRIETPFWVLHRGRRAALFAARHDGALALAADDEPLATIPAGPAGVEALAGVALRPKAIPLTMFARLGLGDLFIHGIGGGRYDRVTDAICERLFGHRPAPYLVATATLFLTLGGDADAVGERRALERRLMDLRHNPDRHLDALSEEQRRLVDEKWTLIRAVETMRPGPDRRAATHRIRELNGRLASSLAGEIARLETRLEALRAAGAPDGVAGYREFPFFLFDPAAVRSLAG